MFCFDVSLTCAFNMRILSDELTSSHPYIIHNCIMLILNCNILYYWKKKNNNNNFRCCNLLVIIFMIPYFHYHVFFNDEVLYMLCQKNIPSIWRPYFVNVGDQTFRYVFCIYIIHIHNTPVFKRLSLSNK